MSRSGENHLSAVTVNRSILGATPAGGASPAELAEQAADVDATLAALSLLTQRLPQAIDQARQWLAARANEGRLGHDEVRVDDGLRAAVANLSVHLRDAGALAGDVAESLEDAWRITSHLTGGTR